jgi:hypothetical protein
MSNRVQGDLHVGRDVRARGIDLDGPSVINVNSSSDALRVTQVGSGNSFVVEDSASPDATPFVVDTAGRVVIGSVNTFSTFANHQFQQHGVGTGTASQLFADWGNSANGFITVFGKSRGGTVGTRSVALNNDNIFQIRGYADDGSNWIEAARIASVVDGTPGTNDMPGRLSFLTTASGSSTPTERMRINNAGSVTIATSTVQSNARLTVGGGSSTANASIAINQTSATGNGSGALVFSQDGTEQSRLYPVGGGNLVFATGSTYAERMRITNAGNVGIGTSNPASILHLSGGDTSAFMDSSTGTNSNNPRIIMRRSRGTVSSPSAVQSGDNLGQLAARTYGETGYSTASRASILFRATENHTDSAQGTSMLFFTTPNGATNVTERMRIDDAGLITGTGTTLGAWTAYTPTLGGTGWAIGNGTASGFYCQIGKIVHARIRITFGSTSTFGAASALTLALPVTPRGGTGSADAGSNQHYGCAFDASAGTFYPMSLQMGSSVGTVRSIGATIVVTSATAPFTWAVDDQITFNFSYEAA